MVKGRVDQWRKLFEEHEIEWVVYDAHMSPPWALKSLYEVIGSKLPYAQSVRFSEYLNARESRIRKQREEVAKCFAAQILSLRQTEVSVVVAKDQADSEEQIREALGVQLRDHLTEFVDQCAQVFESDNEEVGLDLASLKIEVDKLFSSGDIAVAVGLGGVGAGTGGLLGALGGALGGTLGGLMALGPPGAIVGFWWGLKGGAAMGAITGGLGGSVVGYTSSASATLTTRVEEDDVLRLFADTAVLWAMALACHCFGRGEAVSAASLREIEGLPDDGSKKRPPDEIDLTSASELEIYRWMLCILDTQDL